VQQGIAEQARWRPKASVRVQPFSVKRCLINACTLLHRQLCLVSIARNHGVLERMLLLVLHVQRLAFVVHQEHFDVPVTPIVLCIRRPIGEHILIAD